MTENNRDDFPLMTKWRLAQRVGLLCSFEDCQLHTTGPSEEAEAKVNNVGVACHICGAAPGPGSRRYDSKMTPEERSSIENGIWLCGTHSRQIDNDEVTWTVEKLKAIKAAAEQRQSARIGKPGATESVQLLSAAGGYFRDYKAAYVVVEIVNPSGSPNSIRGATLKVGDKIHAANTPRENLSINGFPWLPARGLRLESVGVSCGAWYFGHSFLGGGDDVAAVECDHFELTVLPVRGDPIVLDVPNLEAASQVAVSPPAVSEAHVALDTTLFAAIDSFLPEQDLEILLNRLTTSDDYCRSQAEPLDRLVSEAKLESNQFFDKRLRALHSELAKSTAALLVFLATNFFVFPNHQPLESDWQFALQPDLNTDRASSYSLENSLRYSGLQKDLDSSVRDVRKKYQEFRKAVREVLAK
ncbi:MAG TPA: hypothetical protein VGK67_39720 [Myxococcales bacterium]